MLFRNESRNGFQYKNFTTSFIMNPIHWSAYAECAIFAQTNLVDRTAQNTSLISNGGDSKAQLSLLQFGQSFLFVLLQILDCLRLRFGHRFQIVDHLLLVVPHVGATVRLVELRVTLDLSELLQR